MSGALHPDPLSTADSSPPYPEGSLASMDPTNNRSRLGRFPAGLDTYLPESRIVASHADCLAADYGTGAMPGEAVGPADPGPGGPSGGGILRRPSLGRMGSMGKRVSFEGETTRLARPRREEEDRGEGEAGAEAGPRDVK